MQSQPLYEYDNRVWFWDRRLDPFAEGKPDLIAYSDLISTIIEKHLHDFLSKIEKDPEVIIHPDYVVDIEKCLQININDRNK